MSKNFFFKKLEENMSIIEQVPYRPWCEDHQQEGPVDFSLKSRKPFLASDDQTDIRSQLFVRTPDSGFNSPSESEFRKSTNLASPVGHFRGLYSSESSHQVEEQVVPLSLVKKKSSRLGIRESSSENNSGQLKFPFSSQYNLLSHQASAVQMISSSLYWHNNNSAPFTSIASSSRELSPERNFLNSPPGSSSKSSYLRTTPSKVSPRSSESSILSPIKRKTPSSSVTPEKKSKSLKKTKASRKLNFDEDKTSPVSGTIIRQLEEGEEPLVVRRGDIDPADNIVEITEEAKAELSKIENKIGEYVCRLCKELYDDAFGLAQHRCSRIIHVEYRCPECDKVFNCPANLASHRRWHKPKGVLSSSCHKLPRNDPKAESSGKGNFESDSSETPDLIPLSEYTELSSQENEDFYECSLCLKNFKKQSYLRKHVATHHNNQEPPEEHEESTITQHHPFSMFSPSSSSQLQPITPLLSPPFSENVFRCRLCSATFFTPGALQLHYSSLHDSDDQPSSSFLAHAMHLPSISQFSPKNSLLNYASYPLLSRPSQISAPS